MLRQNPPALRVGKKMTVSPLLPLTWLVAVSRSVMACSTFWVLHTQGGTTIDWSRNLFSSSEDILMLGPL